MVRFCNFFSAVFIQSKVENTISIGFEKNILIFFKSKIVLTLQL